MRGSWLHRTFGDRLLDPHLWHFDRQGVALGLAIGGFFSQIPIPLQSLPAVMIAILLRANIPVAIAGCWITNPFTFAPFLYAQLVIGSFLLGRPGIIEQVHEMTWMEILKAAPVVLMLGGTVMGAIVAAFSHFLGGKLYDFTVRRIAEWRANSPSSRV